MEEPRRIIDHAPDHAPSPFEEARKTSQRRRFKMLRIWLWGALLAAATAVSAAIGWTPLGGEDLVLAQFLSLLFGAMAVTALVGRLVVDLA